MLNPETIGYIGTGLVIVAYAPQIAHLWRFRCAWGISLWSWVIWLIASLLLLLYAAIKNDVIFTIVQVLNMLSILTTIVLYRKTTTACPYHLSKK